MESERLVHLAVACISRLWPDQQVIAILEMDKDSCQWLLDTIDTVGVMQRVNKEVYAVQCYSKIPVWFCRAATLPIEVVSMVQVAAVMELGTDNLDKIHREAAYLLVQEPTFTIKHDCFRVEAHVQDYGTVETVLIPEQVVHQIVRFGETLFSKTARGSCEDLLSVR